jgi:hypothetical protein
VISVYAWSNFHIGQPSFILLALMLGAFVALQQKRGLLAGALIGFAAAIKAFPVIALVYLVYRRFWLAAASLVATIVLLFILLPIPVRGFEQARTDLERWTTGMLFKYDDSGMAQRPRRSNSWKNQSIWGVANRLLRPVDADDQHAAHVPLYVNVADLSFPTVNKIILGTALALGLAYITVMPRRGCWAGDVRDRSGVAPPAGAALHAAHLRLHVRVAALPRDRDRAPADATSKPRIADQRCGRATAAGIDDSVPAHCAGLREHVLRYADLVRGLALELWRVKRRQEEAVRPAARRAEASAITR